MSAQQESFKPPFLGTKLNPTDTPEEYSDENIQLLAEEAYYLYNQTQDDYTKANTTNENILKQEFKPTPFHQIRDAARVAWYVTVKEMLETYGRRVK